MKICAVPEELVGGVYVPVHELPTPFVKLPMVPADFVKNALPILTRSSLEVIVRVVVWPAVNVPDPDRVMEMLGTGVVESIVIAPVYRVERLPDLSIPYA